MQTFDELVDALKQQLLANKMNDRMELLKSYDLEYTNFLIDNMRDLYEKKAFESKDFEKDV